MAAGLGSTVLTGADGANGSVFYPGKTLIGA